MYFIQSNSTTRNTNSDDFGFFFNTNVKVKKNSVRYQTVMKIVTQKNVRSLKLNVYGTTQFIYYNPNKNHSEYFRN